jgi:hypothetical protein
MTAPFDHDRLLAEIDEEVRRRRESGEIPADLERELDLVFARFAPVTALDADFEQVLTRAEQSTFIDTVAPVESSRPIVPIFKKVVRKLIGWYLRYVAQQTTGFAHAITRAVRLLGERVDVLEQASPPARPSTPPRYSVVHEWVEVVVDRMRKAPGRVVHAEAGDGVLLAALVEAGIDAYGVDPYDRPQSARFEIREDTAAVHLRALPDGALGGVVLSGCVDRLPLGAQVQLADLAVAKTAPGGTVVVVSAEPRAWERGLAEDEVDFTPGRPLRAASWSRLLSERAMVDVAVVNGERPPVLKAVPRGHAVLNENLAVLNDELFGPSSYAVVARKP